MTSMRMDHFDKQLREDRLAHFPPAMLPRQPPPLDQNGKMVVSRA
ncbi:eukaryotic translation initiation factor 3 subunit EifCa [Aspergillus luchuensis]|uniref:Eukaryotic translation initiation factor 3 subunit EifCa n=1 Tax=Aspergillus kawachii TaxID=1069201 RepID=A0A146FBE2_ASPKA|nr:eukaryotic translation initiation factor 3 subunit EifCa [Aspergillus luchuensis]